MPRSNRNPRKRKRKPLVFNQEYFNESKRLFNPSFLAKSPVERSGMLAGYYRKLAHTHGSLANIYSWICKQEDKAELLQTKKARENFLNNIFKKKLEETDIATSLFEDAAKIFSEEYGRAITSSLHVKTPEQARLHECHQFLYKSERQYNRIRMTLFS